MWMDIHVMIFIGFGFLMVFLKTHSWSAIGFNYLVAAWAMQLCILFQGWWKCIIVKGFGKKIDITMVAIIDADFGAAACLISMGALLGKCTFPQLMLIVTIEAFFFTLNCTLLLEFWKCMDIGGAMTIHMFGAYFGLTASYFYQPKKAIEDVNGRNGGSYNS